MEEFVPERTSAYISQHDLHIGEMTVRETLAFSARCQGVGPRYGELKPQKIWHLWFKLKYSHESESSFSFIKFSEMLAELSRREKEANIMPDPDLDIYMKVNLICTEFSVYNIFQIMQKCCWKKSISISWNAFQLLQAASLEGQETSVVTDYILKVDSFSF